MEIRAADLHSLASMYYLSKCCYSPINGSDVLVNMCAYNTYQGKKINSRNILVWQFKHILYNENLVLQGDLEAYSCYL